MAAGDRFKSWIESLAESWKDRLAGWLVRWLGGGLEFFTTQLEPGFIELARATADRMQADPNIPQEIKDALAKASGTGNILATIYLEAIMIVQSVGLILQGSVPISNELRYAQDYLKRSSRLDPASVITAWRRDNVTYKKYFDDLREQGWSEDRIEALKFVTLFYPGPSDLVRFQAREVFEPEMIGRYGLDDEFEGIDLEPFRKAGMTDEIALYYWRAHWEHASWNQVVEMLHRGQLTEAEVRDWFRLVEIPPFWRDKLIATSWNVPTRVDVRRFYDLKTIDESRLREIYTAMGYHDKDLDDYVLWTKIYVELPDLIARWKNGWITLDDARERLVNLGMTPANAEELIQTKVKVEEPDDIRESKALTKTEIYKGVKQGKISREEGVDLLVDLGYSWSTAELLLTLNVPVDEEEEVVEQRDITKSDIKAGIKAGILSESEAREKLLELRYTAADAEYLLKLYQYVAEPPEEPVYKEALKSDIVKGVKKGLITQEEGYLMLLEIGYSPSASQFIITVNTEESPFSPANYNEFKDLIVKYKRTQSMEPVPVPEELKAAADELVKIRLEVEALERSEKEEKAKLTAEEPVPDSASATLKQIQVSLNRARSELQRQQLAYDSLVARWKHGAG